MAAYSNCHFVSASFPQHATDCATYDVSHQRLPLRRELHGDLPTSHQVCGFLTNLHDIFKGGRGGGSYFCLVLNVWCRAFGWILKLFCPGFL